jgi:hypothetical protein
MPQTPTIKTLLRIGTEIFYRPKNLKDFCYLVENSLSGNTFRGFHRIDKTLPGASIAFKKVMTNKKKDILDSIVNAQNENDLEVLSKLLTIEFKKELTKNIKHYQLESFNKIRKPIDIFIEHLVAVCNCFDIDTRNRVVPLLFLPLDSQIFNSTHVFSDIDMKKLNIRRSYSFHCIKQEEKYIEIQLFLKNKSKKVRIERIFFDLLWGNRITSNGKNLLEMNPSKKRKIKC